MRHHRLHGFLAGLALTAGLALPTAPSHAAFNLAQAPLFLAEALPPRVMLALSRDHEMFKEAYPDYSDLNGDGRINRTYTDSFSYYGYFDSNRCYTYADGRFQPAGAAGGPNGHWCVGEWSGNFLNWATMTRMDIVRRVLYGGYRHVDTNDLTVLQRELIPNSSHAFVKIFSGGVDGDLTTTLNVTPYAGTVSMCNVTWATSGLSRDVDRSANPPQLRVAAGNWPEWAATERRQCAWRNQRDGSSPSGAHPRHDIEQLTTVNVRVEACRPGALGSNCRLYPNGNYKPAGLLQRYGENNQIHFGLISGSWARNTSGGVLRRNIGPLAGNTGDRAQENEVDPQTGVFVNTADGRQSIVNAINRMRISQWDYGSTWFNTANCSAGGNPWGVTDIGDGQCPDWGNPVGEIMVEALRYFAGRSGPSAAYDANDESFIPGLPRVGSGQWRDPLPEEAFCAKSNVVLLSSGVTTHDAGSAASYGPANDVPGLNVSQRTNEVGSGEGLSGAYLLGGSNRQCTAETFSGLADAQGVCPEGPSLLGGYRIAGVAHHGWTHDLRPDYPDSEQNVKTYAVNLAEPLPRLRFGNVELLPTCQSRPNSSSPWATCAAVQTDILDAQYNGAGSLNSAHVRVFWEDSTYGSDYDMDGVVDLHICRGPDSCNDSGMLADDVRVDVNVMAAFAGFDLRFGVLADGTTDDGLSPWVFRPGGQNFSVLANQNPGLQPESMRRYYSPGTSSATLLRDPLWYAAKWGGFDREAGSTPASTAQWDANGDGDPDNYYLVRNPARLEADLEQVFSDITAAVSSASAIATNSTQLSTETILYQARFNTEDWTGELLGYGIAGDGSVGNLLWDAGERIPAPHNRNIFTVDTDGEGIVFEWDELDGTQQQLLDRDTDGLTDGLGPQRLEWIRGERLQEQAAGGPLRDRSRVLGDIVNSDPQFVGALNFGYEGLPSAHAPRYTHPTRGHITNGYDDYRRAQLDSNGRPLQPTVYVGANDGMLHAFDAETGVERFAYVPGSLIGELNRLPDPDYVHRYFVDGQIFVGHAYIERDGSTDWRTVLIGTLGAGGRTVFALDVTDPESFSEEDVLWEVSSDTPGFENLGHILTQPVIAPLPGGRWAAVFGNGYNGNSQRASLFVVDLATGERIREVPTGVGGADNPNGLSGITLLPRGDRVIEAGYGGDMLGNLWKFDLSHSNSGNWESAFRSGSTPVPLFTARGPNDEVQPITANVEIGRHPQTGFMVYFGTGKYFENDDNIVGPNPDVQTFYGIWDNGSRVNPSAARDTALRRQDILVESVDGASGTEFRVTSDHEPDWSSHRGWYLDLVSPVHGTEGERAVARPIVSAGRIIFTTTIPSPSPCDAGGSSWLMEMDAVSGARLSYSPLDLNNDGLVDDDDFVTVEIPGEGLVTVPVSGVRSREGIIQTPTIISAGEVEYKLASGTSGEVEVFRERGAIPRARGSWRQLR